MKKVSIIVPCYNGENFIDRSFKSIYYQDYSNIELIFIDDGSSDMSKVKALSWKEKMNDKGIELIYFYQSNLGAGAAINAGLKLVTGEYLILLDVDDEFLQGAIREKVDYLEKNPSINVVRANGWNVKGSSKYLFITEREEKENKDIFLTLLRGETNNWAGSYMVRTTPLFIFYPNREVYKSRYGQNLQLLLPLVYKNKCGFIDKPHMNYIRQDNSLSQTSDPSYVLAKSIENANGYLDIRLHMLECIVTESDRDYYLNRIYGAHWRNMMMIALMNKEKALLEKAFNEIHKYEKATIDDRINFYSLSSKSKMYFFKIIRKVGKLIQ